MNEVSGPSPSPPPLPECDELNLKSITQKSADSTLINVSFRSLLSKIEFKLHLDDASRVKMNVCNQYCYINQKK